MLTLIIMKNRKEKGFTLIELILVIAIIAILAAAVFVALDPARRLHESRNARRYSDVTNLLDAVVKYQVDNAGNHYDVIDAAATNALASGEFAQIGTTVDRTECRDASAAYTTAATLCGATAGAGAAQDDCVDLSGIGSNYMASIPADPNSGTDLLTRYYISRDANGAITIGSCDEEGEGAGGTGTAPAIELSR